MNCVSPESRKRDFYYGLFSKRFIDKEKTFLTVLEKFQENVHFFEPSNKTYIDVNDDGDEEGEDDDELDEDGHDDYDD